MLSAKIDTLTNMFGKLNTANAMANVALYCENCGGSHNSAECMQVENAQFVSNFNRPQQANPFSNTYNPGWRNHPNFSWSNPNNAGPSNARQFNPQQFQPRPQQVEVKQP